MIILRPLQSADIELVAGSAREADVREIRDGAGWSIAEALEYGLVRSERCQLMLFNAQPLAVVGDVRHENIGIPWMITTHHVDRHARAFLHSTREILAEMLDRHEALTNFIDARNTRAIRWLRWLGFEIAEPMPRGVAGLPFHQFTKIRG